jgi:uncharacterized protein
MRVTLVEAGGARHAGLIAILPRHFTGTLIVALAVFLAIVLIGSYVQAVAGFAMGLLIIAVAASTTLFDLEITAAAVSLLSLVNILLSLRGHYHLVQGRTLRLLTIGQLPAIALGIWLLGVLNSNLTAWLQMLLALFLIGGSAAMMLRPVPLDAPSGTASTLTAGFAGGLLGGLFAASGPVMGWFCYRQPLPVTEIRATLLGCFALTTLARTLMVAATGALSMDVAVMAGAGLPLVLVGTWLGRRFPPSFGEATMRRVAFGALLAMGVWIGISASFALLAAK